MSTAPLPVHGHCFLLAFCLLLPLRLHPPSVAHLSHCAPLFALFHCPSPLLLSHSSRSTVRPCLWSPLVNFAALILAAHCVWGCARCERCCVAAREASCLRLHRWLTLPSRLRIQHFCFAFHFVCDRFNRWQTPVNHRSFAMRMRSVVASCSPVLPSPAPADAIPPTRTSGTADADGAAGRRAALRSAVAAAIQTHAPMSHTTKQRHAGAQRR